MRFQNFDEIVLSETSYGIGSGAELEIFGNGSFELERIWVILERAISTSSELRTPVRSFSTAVVITKVVID